MYSILYLLFFIIPYSTTDIVDLNELDLPIVRRPNVTLKYVERCNRVFNANKFGIGFRCRLPYDCGRTIYNRLDSSWFGDAVFRCSSTRHPEGKYYHTIVNSIDLYIETKPPYGVFSEYCIQILQSPKFSAKSKSEFCYHGINGCGTTLDRVKAQGVRINSTSFLIRNEIHKHKESSVCLKIDEHDVDLLDTLVYGIVEIVGDIIVPFLLDIIGKLFSIILNDYVPELLDFIFDYLVDEPSAALFIVLWLILLLRSANYLLLSVVGVFGLLVSHDLFACLLLLAICYFVRQ
jgi:hypothetical protein